MCARESRDRKRACRTVPRRGARFVVAVAAALASAAAFAWPDQPLALVVPFTPGTGVDFIARHFASRLPAVLGQPVVVENITGAAGTIGTEKVARAKPDGHMLLVQSLSFSTGPSLYKSARYDPIADFAPVSLVARQSYVLVVPATLPARTEDELFAAAARSPGMLTYATPGVGTLHHIATVLILQKAGVTMLHIPYKGTAGAVADLLGGRVDVMLLPTSVLLPHVQSGRLVALATGSLERLPQLPSVPTLVEARIDAVVATPEYATALEAQGMVPAPPSSDSS